MQSVSDKLTDTLLEMRASVALRHLTEAEVYQSGPWPWHLSRYYRNHPPQQLTAF